MKKGSVLITGGAGFVGQAISEIFISKAYELAIVGRSEAPRGIRGSYRYIKADLSFPIKIDEKYDLWVHAAADINSHQDVLSNIVSTKNALEGAVLNGAKKFIYLSSVPLIGEPSIVPIDEAHPVKPLSAYHLAKYCGELLCFLPTYALMKSIVLRLPAPIGPALAENRLLSVLLKAAHLGNDLRLLGKGGRVQNYIDIHDVARAVFLASLQAELSGVFLIGGHSMSNLDLAKLCLKIAASSSKIVFEDSDPEESFKWIINGQKARNYLNYTPVMAIEESIKRVWNSMPIVADKQVK